MRKNQPRSSKSTVKIAAAVAAVLVLAWLLWPSRYANIENLDSRGANIIAFGDSLTAGYGAGDGEDYPARLSQQIGVPILNAGVSGDTTESALARIEEDVLSRDPRIVIVGLGGNDFLRGVPIATTEANLRSIIQHIHTSGAMVVLLGFTFPTLGRSYDDMYEDIADDEHCLLIPRTLRGILRDPKLRSDAIHPNAAGYQLMAERVAGPLRKLIAKAND